jgi:peroxiredoxin
MNDRDMQALLLSAERRWLDGWLTGPTIEGRPLRRGDPAPDPDLLDTDGNSVNLASTWGDAPALILLWRHLGCGCGIERARRLRDEIPSYLEAGLNVVIAAPAEPARVAAYHRSYDVPAQMLADPGYTAHKAFGLGHWSEEQALYDAPPEFCERGEETGIDFQAERRAEGRPLVDDPWMQSGEFLVGTNGVIRVAYAYNYCEDYPDPRIYLTAARLVG